MLLATQRTSEEARSAGAMESVAPRFISAVQWNAVISFATVIVQLGIIAVVARLLTPSDFGLYAIASVVLVIARNFGDGGLISAVVREPVLSREVVGAAVFISCIMASALSFVVLILAPLVAVALSSTEKNLLEPLIRLVSMSLLISGLGAPAQAMMQRDLRFRELGFLRLAGIVVGTGGVTIVLAAGGRGAWSLAWGEIANTTVLALGALWVVRERWTVSWHRAHTLRIGLVGVQMTILRVLDALWFQLPLVVLQANLSSFDVGLYQRSQTLVDMGIQYTTGRVSSVLFPVLAARQNCRALMSDVIPPMVGLYALFLFPVTVFVGIMAPDIVVVMLGSGWKRAAGPLVFIMIAFTILHTSQPASSQLEARAVFGPRMLSAGLGVVSVVAFSLVLIGLYGLLGIAFAAIISATITAIINLAAAVRRSGVPVRDLAGWLLRSATVSAFLAAAMMACYPLLLAYMVSPAARLAVMGLVAAMVTILGFRLFIGTTRRRTLANYLSQQPSRPTLAIAKVLGVGT